MIKVLFAAATLGMGAIWLPSAASSMPVDAQIGAPGSGTTAIALYCNRRGACVRAPRAGYVLRAAPAPRVVVRPAPRVVVKPNRGKVVVRP